jgi:Ser/Thr protein kinase RdoA (MazF antagonist)
LQHGLFKAGARERRWRAIMRTLQDVAAGMAHMHGQRCCHGDLNPANILFKARLCCL